MFCVLVLHQRLSDDNVRVEVVKSLETIDLIDVPSVLDRRIPSFVAYRYRGPLTSEATSALGMSIA